VLAFSLVRVLVPFVETSFFENRIMQGWLAIDCQLAFSPLSLTNEKLSNQEFEEFDFCIERVNNEALIVTIMNVTMALPLRLLLRPGHRPSLLTTTIGSHTKVRSGGAAMLYAVSHRRLFSLIKHKNNVDITFPPKKWSMSTVRESSSSSSVMMLGSCALVSVIFVAVASATLVSTDLEKMTSAKKENDEKACPRHVSYQFPVDFMDKLAAKPYLHFADYSFRRRRGDANSNNVIDDDDDDAHDDSNSNSERRPVGVPRNLRLLAVDLPELRQDGYFSGGQCRMAANHVYPDGIAPPVLLQVSPSPQRDEPEYDKKRDSNFAAAGNRVKMDDTKKNQTRRNINKKTRHVDDHHSDATTTVSVEQKAWVKSMFRCVHGSSSSSSSSSNPRVGVRVMEAQTAVLNPLNLVKTPHPLLTMGRTKSQQQQQLEQMVESAPSGHDEQDAKEQSSSFIANTNAKNIIPSVFSWRSSNQQSDSSSQDDKKKKKSSDNSNNTSNVHHQQHQLELLRTEEAAPWNQHAWREELELRISGQVAFGDTMQEASGWWNRHVLGRIYQPTIPLYYNSRRDSVSDWIFFWRRRPGGDPKSTTALTGKVYLGRDEGGDGRHHDGHGNDDNEEEFVASGDDWSQSNWSFHHKPHAVIANGSALLRVPQSLRLLQKACREHNVPLYVIHDPRKWGANGSSSNSKNKNTRNDDDEDDELSAVLRDLHRSLKKRIISTSLQQQQLTGSRTAFQRGRWWGRLETNTYWESRETTRKSREAVALVVQKAKALAAAQKRDDWRLVDQATLEEKLVQHGVIRKEHFKVVLSNENGDDEKNEDEAGQCRQSMTKTMQRRIYSKAFSAIAQQWVADQQHAGNIPAVLAQNDDMSKHKKQEDSSAKDNKDPSPIMDKSAPL
jgi:hypothetical protein